ncbi:hypothetical protein B1790_21185 [Mycobacterium sp. AT1]|nr:hypothetical protein B1790_21185 [Mycobacterium sp. AT1]
MQAPGGEQESTVAVVNHDYATVNGHRLLYREAGAADAPVIVLLHGFRGSSHATRWQYLTGVVDQTLVDPDAWLHDYVSLCRPGIDEVQLGWTTRPTLCRHAPPGRRAIAARVGARRGGVADHHLSQGVRER